LEFHGIRQRNAGIRWRIVDTLFIKFLLNTQRSLMYLDIQKQRFGINIAMPSL